MIKVSIIVPVYNTKNYLRRCLDSILAQTLHEIEIICVDDGSVDGSDELLNWYSTNDSRIKVIHQTNQGLVHARKTGIQIAKGKYTGYVDSDDWIEPDMYETLYLIAERYQVDLVSSGYILEKGMKIEFYDGFPEGLYRESKIAVLHNHILFNEEKRDAGIRPSLCNKLFRTSKLKKVQLTIPDELSNCEDRICTVAYMLEAQSVYIVKKAFYHYVFYPNSMSHCEDIYYFDKLGSVYRAFRSMYDHPNFSEALRVQCELYMTKMAIEGINEYLGFLTPDLMRINLKWIEQFPYKSKVILYGAGRLGKIYYRQIISDQEKRIQILHWIDRNYQKLTEYPQIIEPPEIIRNAEYDYILLSLIDKQAADEVKSQLVDKFCVESGKIVWIEQHEIFWDYAKAAGLLKGIS